MIEIILLESEHFSGELMILVESFQVLFGVAEVFGVLVCDVGTGTFFPDDFSKHIGIVVSLRGRVFSVQGLVRLDRTHQVINVGCHKNCWTL